jgi:cytoskeletal protein RodZ
VEKTWTISIVGIIVALGGLGFIAIFFAIVGHFFHKNRQKKNKMNVSSTQGNQRKIPQPSRKAEKNAREKLTAESSSAQVGIENNENDAEIVAVISAAIASFENGKVSKILSITRIPENASRSVWRFHNPQRIWRTTKRK